MAIDKAFFDEAFRGHEDMPPDLKRTAERLVFAYGLRGICDPMYVANVIAYELGRGDGCGNFNNPTPCPDCGRIAGHRRESDCIG